ncbi:ankyrin repeat domain-containing protein [Candidatus Mesenet endosymbiont of Agriotes lineatus]|uniref:ankyrin repeat domain-containing protein n=1 Tax=Candidatus Mesenet endosymbiont of Agriotes lineatus TaxID=3077948 RepID=UPI0030D328E1
MSTQPNFKDVIDSNNPKTVKNFLDSKQFWVNVGDISEVLQYCLKEKKDVKILELIFNRFKGEVKNKTISKNGNSILFLALDTGKDYFEVFKNYENVNWSVLDKNGNNLLHHALSLKDVSEESLDFLYEKLGGHACLFKINDNSENALHCATSLKNFKWCLEKCKTDKIKSLLHNVNNIGETPVVKLLKDKDLLSDKALFGEIINILKDKKYDFLKTDNNEQNAISLAIQNNYYDVSLYPFLSDNPHEEERTEIAFSAIEHGKDNLLKSLGIKDKGDFIVKNHEELIKKCPERFADFVKNDEKILPDYIKLCGTKNSNLVNDELLNLFSKMMYLAIDYADDKLADQCLNQYKLVKYYLSFAELEKKKRVPDLLERQNSAGNTPLDYAYKNNPEIFAKLAAKSSQLKIDVSFRGGSSRESHQISQKEEISANIVNLFTSVGSRGWYDTGGILASLADLVIKKSDDSPTIFVQPGTDDQQRALSDELRKVSKCDKNVIYIRRSPINEKGESSAHWVVFYFFENEEGRRNLLVVDPYGANEPSVVINEAVKGIVDGAVYVSTIKIQRDDNSCGSISSEVARAIYSQKEKLQGLLEGNNQKIDIEQILPIGLINDAKESGRINYGRGFENFNCSKIRNAHVQTVQAIDEAIIDKIDTIPSQTLINKVLAGKENSLDEQIVTIGYNSINNIFNLCQDNNEEKKKVVSILVNKNVTDATLDQEIAFLLSQDKTKVNVKQIDDLEQTLGEEQFKPIRERLDAQIQQPQPLQLNGKQKEKIKQIREKFKSELTNPQKYKIDNSSLYKFLCSVPVGDIGKFLDSKRITKESGDLCKAVFTAARNGDFSRLEAFINYDNGIIYETDVSGKSLLEAAAENFHSEVVRYIIHKHNEIYKDKNGKIAGEVPSEFLGFVDNINNRKDPWAKDLARELKRILRKKDFNESDGLKIDLVFSSYINNKEQEKEVKNFNINDYGNLSFYADIINSGSEEKFKAALEKIDPKLLNGNGHNIITLTAALDTPDHWKEIEKAYSKVEGRTAISASLDDMSSIGSPIQAAIIADNLPMYNHFLDLKDGFIVNKQYGIEKNNVLHTILQSNKVELLNDILFKFKDNKKSLVKALLQVNKDNKSPLDLALEKGRHYGFFEKALDVIANHNKETIRNLLIANDCRLIKSAASFGNERVIERVFNLQDEYNEKIKNKEDQLNLLNYNNRYDKENRLEKSELLNLACGHNNVHTANHILELLKEKNKVSSKVLMNALTASISKDSNNKEIFDFLLGQVIDFKTFSGRFTTPIHKAAKCGNTYALKYFINKFPKNNILNLQNEDGKTPLHLAISNGNRKVVELLIENGADFDKPDNKGITSFKLALENSRFADMCIDLLKYNPEATMPLHRAILSGNNKLIEKLIDQSHWVLEQYSSSSAIINHDFVSEETALKFALRNGISRDLTAKIADKSIKSFNKLDEKSQKTLLKLGFLNDVVKSSIYEAGSKEAGEISKFIRSQVGKDRSLLSIVSQGTTLLHDIINSNNLDFFLEIENDIESEVITKKSDELEETALHVAVRSGNTNIVKTVLDKIGDEENTKLVVNEYDAKGYTPFQTAAKLGHQKIYDLLKEEGGYLKSKTKAGDSIAHLLILSAMKDSTDDDYEYQKLLKNHPKLIEDVNNEGSGLLATAAKCTDQNEAPKIIKQLLENEFKHKKGQFTEEDAVKLLSNAILSNNFDAIKGMVFDNTKGKIANKIANAIAGDGTGTTFKTRARRTIANTITSNSQEYINNISKTKVLSQSIKEVLSDTEEKKQSLLQNAFNFLHIKAQKGSSGKIDVNTLLNFLVKDQGSYANSKFFLVEEEVKVSSARKNVFVQQEELNRKFDTFLKQRSEYPSWQKEINYYRDRRNTLEACEAIIQNIDTNSSVSDIEKAAYKYYCEYCSQHYLKNDSKFKEDDIEEGARMKIGSVLEENPFINFGSYIQQLKGSQSEEDKNKIVDAEFNHLASCYSSYNRKIAELDKKIKGYKFDANNLLEARISQDVFYTNCKDLDGKSIADRVFTSNELPFIRGIILENENLWDPRFVDSEGNTLLHKLAQIAEKDNTLIGYIQPLIDQGFSLIKKNKEGKSVKDILKDVNVNNEIKQTVDNLAKTEEQIHEHFEKGLDSLLDSGSVDDLAKIIHNNEKGYKKYYGTLFNPFHSVVSSCFNGDLSNDYLFDKKSKCFKELLKSNDLRSASDKTDEKRCNFLHRAIEEAAANYGGSDTNKMLERILLDVARGLNGSRNFKLCNELFFKQRNSNGDNVVEALSKVEGGLNIFKKLEKEFGKNTFTDECDLNLILVNAASSKNSDLFEHVIEKYALNRFRAPSEERQSPLHAAVISGDRKTVLTVLKSGANINQVNSSGRTAMHELLIFLRDNQGSQEHIDLVHYLTSRGAFFGRYKEEEENKERGEISEVIESIEGEIQEKILFTIASGRSDFYGMKHKLLNEASNFIKLKNKDSPLELDLDISGSVVFAKIKNGTFKSSQFLNSDVCKSNHLTTSYFDIDGCKGYVQKSMGGKRNYVIFEDGISEESSKKVHHPTKIKVWLSREQSITVLVSAYGTIEPAETSHKIMRVEVKDNLSEYKDRKEEFKRDHSKYKDYIEKLWKKVDSQDEYKNEVYIGGIPLKEALMRGRWRDQGVQEKKQTQSKEQERVQKSPENNTPNYSRRNSKGDEIGETIEDAQIDPPDINQQLQSQSNNATTADADADVPNQGFTAEAAGSEQGKSTRLGVKNNQSISRLGMNDDINDKFSKNLNELGQRFNQKNYGLKNVLSQEQRSDSNKLKSELEQRLARPNKGLKKVDPSKINPASLERLMSDGLLSGEGEKSKNFYKDVSQAVKGIEEGLEGIVEESIQALISNKQEVKNVHPQQVEKLTNKGKKNFYDGVKEVIKEIAEGLKGVADKSNQALKKEMKLELDIDHNDNTNVNTPDSGYGSVVSSPNQEEKGTRDSYESEKSKINVENDQSSSEEYMIKDSGIELGDIKFEIEEQEKGAKDSCKSEKQKNNRLLGKSEVYNQAKLIMVEKYEPKLNEIQMVIKSLVSAQNTKNHMGPKAREKFDKLDTYYKNEQNLRTGNKPSLPPILSSGNNKHGHGR